MATITSVSAEIQPDGGGSALANSSITLSAAAAGTIVPKGPSKLVVGTVNAALLADISVQLHNDTITGDNDFVGTFPSTVSLTDGTWYEVVYSVVISSITHVIRKRVRATRYAD